MAVPRHPDILQHFYTGVTIGTVGSGELVGHAEPLRIGIGQSLTRFDFSAIDGAINPSPLVWPLNPVKTGHCG